MIDTRPRVTAMICVQCEAHQNRLPGEAEIVLLIRPPQRTQVNRLLLRSDFIGMLHCPFICAALFLAEIAWRFCCKA